MYKLRNCTAMSSSRLITGKIILGFIALISKYLKRGLGRACLAFCFSTWRTENKTTGRPSGSGVDGILLLLDEKGDKQILKEGEHNNAFN